MLYGAMAHGHGPCTLLYWYCTATGATAIAYTLYGFAVLPTTGTARAVLQSTDRVRMTYTAVRLQLYYQVYSCSPVQSGKGDPTRKAVRKAGNRVRLYDIQLSAVYVVLDSRTEQKAKKYISLYEEVTAGPRVGPSQFHACMYPHMT